MVLCAMVETRRICQRYADPGVMTQGGKQVIVELRRRLRQGELYRLPLHIGRLTCPGVAPRIVKVLSDARSGKLVNLRAEGEPKL